MLYTITAINRKHQTLEVYLILYINLNGKRKQPKMCINHLVFSNRGNYRVVVKFCLYFRNENKNIPVLCYRYDSELRKGAH